MNTTRQQVRTDPKSHAKLRDHRVLRVPIALEKALNSSTKSDSTGINHGYLIRNRRDQSAPAKERSIPIRRERDTSQYSADSLEPKEEKSRSFIFEPSTQITTAEQKVPAVSDSSVHLVPRLFPKDPYLFSPHCFQRGAFQYRSLPEHKLRLHYQQQIRPAPEPAKEKSETVKPLVEVPPTTVQKFTADTSVQASAPPLESCNLHKTEYSDYPHSISERANELVSELASELCNTDIPKVAERSLVEDHSQATTEVSASSSLIPITKDDNQDSPPCSATQQSMLCCSRPSYGDELPPDDPPMIISSPLPPYFPPRNVTLVRPIPIPAKFADNEYTTIRETRDVSGAMAASQNTVQMNGNCAPYALTHNHFYHKGHGARLNVPTLLSGDNRDYDEVAEFGLQARNSTGTRSSGHKEVVEVSDHVSRDDVLELREKVADNEVKLHTLTSTNVQILKMVTNLQATVEKLCGENSCLREEVSRLHESHHQAALQRRLPSPITNSAFQPVSGQMSTSHPHHAMNTNGGSITERASSMPKQIVSLSDAESSRGARRHGSMSAAGSRGVPSGRRSADHHREMEEHGRREPLSARGAPPPVEDRPTDQFSNKEYAREHARIQDVFQDNVFPDNLIIETEKLTQAIRSLLDDSQVPDKRLLVTGPSHAHRIASLVNSMLSLVPSHIRKTGANPLMDDLMDATMILSAKCNAPMPNCEQTCQAAYGVAKAAKQLLFAVNQ